MSQSSPVTETDREAADPDSNSVVGLELSGIAQVARNIVTEWLGMFDPPPQIDFQQSEFLQGSIAAAIESAGHAPCSKEPIAWRYDWRLSMFSDGPDDGWVTTIGFKEPVEDQRTGYHNVTPLYAALSDTSTLGNSI